MKFHFWPKTKIAFVFSFFLLLSVCWLLTMLAMFWFNKTFNLPTMDSDKENFFFHTEFVCVVIAKVFIRLNIKKKVFFCGITSNIMTEDVCCLMQKVSREERYSHKKTPAEIPEWSKAGNKINRKVCTTTMSAISMHKSSCSTTKWRQSRMNSKTPKNAN